nr:YetF domain-containing protein [Metabacillus fastidiosus]
MEAEPFDLPRTIIKEGKINFEELKQINKDKIWVVSNLERLYQTEVKNVLLATLDKKDNRKVFYISKFFKI